MSRKQAAALAAVAAAAVLVAWIALSSRQPPLLPKNDLHATFTSAHECLGCHGPGGPSPRSARHPLGEDCLRCHGSR